MVTGQTTGGELLIRTLEHLGTKVVFGLPGTQTLPVHDALRRSEIRTLTCTHELAASFMAAAYYRASDQVGVLLTIAGPGFTYAVTGLAQARLDSAAVIHLVCKAPPVGRPFQVQAMDELAVADPLVKRTFRASTIDDIPTMVVEAYEEAVSGEPGPTVVLLEAEALTSHVSDSRLIRAPRPRFPDLAAELGDRLFAAVSGSARTVVFAGQGANGAAAEVQVLAERLNAPVFASSSGRGIVPDDHPLALGIEPATACVEVLNQWLSSADLVLSLGCKMGDSGTSAFRLSIPERVLVRIDTSMEALDANYPAFLRIHGDVGTYVRDLLARLGNTERHGQGWATDELEGLKRQLATDEDEASTEPEVTGTRTRTAADFLKHLRAVVPRDAIATTDSGTHQYLVRRNFDILAPRGLMIPGGLQSMGCAIPAAIAAKLGAPTRPVVAFVGDGGFSMCGMELLTAVNEDIPLTVFLLTDGFFGLIRMQQLFRYGHAHAVDLPRLDARVFASAVGAKHVLMGQDVRASLAGISYNKGVNVVEVNLRDSGMVRRLRAKQLIKDVLPAKVVEAGKILFGRRD